MVNALSTFLDQPAALVSPTTYSLTLQRSLYICFGLTLLFAASHYYTLHLVDGTWDAASIAVGFYCIRPLRRGVGQSGFSLRWLTRYSLWNLFNVSLYVAAFVYQQVLGYPPVLPLNPPGGWDALDKTQKEVAIVSYDVEPAAYIAIAVVLWLLYKELKAVPYRPVGAAEKGETYQSLIAN
jgi:hypothetical protein